MSLMKDMTDKSSDSGSNSSNGGGSGNNSDNSALISIGNTSFGFNFDSEEGIMNQSAENSNNSEEGDSDNSQGNRAGRKAKEGRPTGSQSKKAEPKPKAATVSSDSSAYQASHNDAAAAAVANLQSIANESNKRNENEKQKAALKRKAEDDADNDSTGYNSDDDDEGKGDGDHSKGGSSQGNDDNGGQKGGRKKKKKLDDMKREERNAREKERSFRISRQINELRGLLSTGGVIVPKGTKSSVLTEAANYIRMLQQHQYRSEIDRHQLVQQIQMIGGGALGQQAATTVRHVAAQNGVWSLGNFGGVPPKSAMMYHQPNPMETASDSSFQQAPQAQDGSVLPNKIEDPDYRHIFNSSTVGMAIASMGGAFIDCNHLFCQLSNYTKQEVCSMTIFNLTARQDLQHAFDLISQMLSAPPEPDGNSSSTSCVLRGALKHRGDLGLSVTMIKGDDGVAKCFNVTLVICPTSPFDNSRPMPATVEHVQQVQGLQSQKDTTVGTMDQNPTYTAG